MNCIEDKCIVAHHIIDQLKQNKVDDYNVFDNHKKTLISICEYLIDSGINCELYEQCLNQQIFVESDIPQELHNKRALATVINFFESIEPFNIEIEYLPKIISNVIQIYCSDPNAEILKSIPSLIGIIGMISIFHLYSKFQIQQGELIRHINILLPESSEQPYVASSRKYCLSAIEALLKTPIKEGITDSNEYLQNIQEVKYILSRYPLIRTIEHIKHLLYQFKEICPSSTLRNVFYNYLNGKIVSKPFSWPSTDFISIREIQTAMGLDSTTFQAIVFGEDPKVKDFLLQQQSDLIENYQSQYIHQLTQPHIHQHQLLLQQKIKCDKEEKSKKKPSLKLLENSSIKIDDGTENNKLKKKKRRFTEEETQNLIEGVQQFGIGHWKLILNNFKFDDRSCVDLKDKWRNLENSRLRNNKQKSNEPTMTQFKSNGTILPPFNSDNY
ncbi:hypothetical protein CL6EHI_001110 [Entamoeba histolytica]|uniref:Myb family DNA-binding domain containing protein n=3 Tax=Entamoeba histolytica TaxID=5759 RepID=C4M1J1_ENTH1|nr:hypothetical protein EHI_001110 [Entamoeba histolytica HM-1:IMSS]EAL44492.1 hypothetical protein EHI_001110 [Entamoeba histolytica HM-1:IMSS]EMD45337.1 Myb family DNAbinding domain containing protein [Entamoeba histolytica KU27]GAT95085.1 hypothetical protein CL6EHI_001110 [Entamoeba histolytica]|eukprot:XP_649880.1 hypothetical protein EHI_001110 [Entamoeba histolytica HM-1:IMSS]